MTTQHRRVGRYNIVGCVSLIFLAAILLGGVVFLTTQIPEVSEQLPGNATPFIVTLVTPLNGTAIPLNELIIITAEALSSKSITALELWIDGELLQAETLPPESNTKQFRTVWGWKPSTEGDHTLLVRARNIEQRSGNSNVVRVTALKGLLLNAPYTTQQGDTVETVAQQFKTTPQQIVDLNPKVNSNASLPAGEPLTVPLPSQPIISVLTGLDEIITGPEQALPPSSSSLPEPDPTPLPPSPTVPTGPTQVPSGSLNKNLFWLKKILSSLISTPQFPVAPELAATVDQCQVSLFVSDQSDNEDGFFIYRLDSTVSAPKLIATLGATSTSLPIQYADSGLNGYVQYQVASFNSAGESLSNFVGLKITDSTCFTPQWKMLAFTKMNLVVPQPLDKVYLYLSINDGPWKKIPSGQNQFIYPSKNMFDVSQHLGQIPIHLAQGDSSFAFEVWGWKGNSLIRVGRVTKTISASQSEGATEIKGEGFALLGEFRNVANKYESSGSPVAPSISPPTRLESTSDPKVCVNHAPLGLSNLFTSFACVFGIENNYVVLVWNWKPWNVCPYPKCISVNGIDGYRIYRILETAYTYKADLIRTVTGADLKVTLFPWNDLGPGQCFVVRAFKGAMESDASNKVCLQLPPMGTVATTDTPFTTNDQRFDAETAAAVIPPHANQGCWDNGRLLIGAGSSDGTALLSRDLVGSASVKDIRTLLPLPAPDNNVPSFDPFNHSYTGQPLPQHWLTSDHQIARLPNGDLLFIRHGHTVAPLTPKPAWWNDIIGPPAGKFTPRPGERTATAVWRSSDCGNTWKLVSKIDAAVVSVEGEAGRCGWPQKNAKGDHGAGGFDRSELYVDPWNGTVYIASACMSGHEGDHLFRKAVLFISKNSGDTWQDARALDYQNTPEVWTPIALTSVPSGRVYVFGCTSGGEPRLFWSDDQGKTVVGPHKVYYGSATNAENKCGTVIDSKIPGGQRNGGYPIAGISSLSRVSSTADEDIIRVAYASIIGTTNPRQVQRILSVHIKSDGTVTAIPVKTIVAEHPLGHVLQATFIESDRVELPKNSTSNVAVMYWIESTDKQLFARYSVARGESIWSVPADLSVTGGQRRSWVPNNKGWAGDYMHGAFFFDGTNLNYLAQWPESESQYKEPNMIIHYNIVQVPFSQGGPFRQIK